MEKYLPILQQCALFDGIAPEDMPGMLSCLGATVRQVGRNQQIFAEGEKITDVGILLSGSARVEKLDIYGTRQVVSGVRPGELFGESFACAEVASLPVSVVADEDCAVMQIPCQRITVGCSNACCFHSRLIFNLLKIVAARNLEFHQKLEITAQRTTREKLMAYLLVQARSSGKREFRRGAQCYEYGAGKAEKRRCDRFPPQRFPAFIIC